MTTAKRSTGLTAGRVTQRRRCSAPAPSSWRRLVEVARNVEQRGEEDDHRVADAPEPEQHERRLRPRRRLEPQRAGDPEPAQDRVHRPRRRIEDVGEAERRRHRRRERGQVEDRAEEADAGLGAHDHARHAEGEDDLQRHGEGHQPQRVAHRVPDLRVVVEHERVVGRADPARVRDQVVVRERQVHAGQQRIAEEDREADDPRAHQPEHEPAPAPRRLAARRSAVPHLESGRGTARRERRRAHG